VEETLEKDNDLPLAEPTGEVCEKCGRPMLKKLGRFGYFLACSGFPECHNAKSLPLAKCPKCSGDIVARKGKNGRGREFYGCTNYPDCDFMTIYKPLEQNCPKCGWFLVQKSDKKNGLYKSCINPGCDYLHTAESGTEEGA
jgi:DNA topoisomerase-1